MPRPGQTSILVVFVNIFHDRLEGGLHVSGSTPGIHQDGKGAAVGCTAGARALEKDAIEVVDAAEGSIPLPVVLVEHFLSRWRFHVSATRIGLQVVDPPPLELRCIRVPVLPGSIIVSKPPLDGSTAPAIRPPCGPSLLPHRWTPALLAALWTLSAASPVDPLCCREQCDERRILLIRGADTPYSRVGPSLLERRTLLTREADPPYAAGARPGGY